MKANELSIIATGRSLDERIADAREQMALFTKQRMMPKPELEPRPPRRYEAKQTDPEEAIRMWNATLQLLLILKEH